MNKFRFLTAGESHGTELVVIIDGVPSLLPLSIEDVNVDLAERQIGYGRSERMRQSKDMAKFISGVRKGYTTGAPIAISIENGLSEEWKGIMSFEKTDNEEGAFTLPRPGHADLAGYQKYRNKDLRDVLERASARETASRVACGAIAKKILCELGIEVYSRIKSLGGILSSNTDISLEYFKKCRGTEFGVLDSDVADKMRSAIDDAKVNGQSLGGVFEVVAFGVPAGLGSYAQWDRRLDGHISMALMSIPGIKGVAFGEGFELAKKLGSDAQDAIYFEEGNFTRHTNYAGGIEGGMSNGMPIVASCVMKPIPTLPKGLCSADIITHASGVGNFERADVCALRSASVVAEAMMSITLVNAVLDRFAGDDMTSLKGRTQNG